ncbi:MAG TPA: hypothetical protein VNN10_01770 [Dehalococcoidia bacterium]|nr:hypothetical protein [Dehalococcoidia bacterium]
MRRLTWLAAALLVLAFSGCVDNSMRADGTPRAPTPDLDAGLRGLASGTLDLPLAAGETRDLDPVNMALNLGLTPPACADFVLAFTWQVRFPQPVTDARIHFVGERMGGTFEVGGPGPAGEATVGCALLRAINEGPVAVVVQMRFTVATSRR